MGPASPDSSVPVLESLSAVLSRTDFSPDRKQLLFRQHAFLLSSSLLPPVALQFLQEDLLSVVESQRSIPHLANLPGKMLEEDLMRRGLEVVSFADTSIVTMANAVCEPPENGVSLQDAPFLL